MIDRIRSKSWLVIVVVGLGLLLFLVPPDAFASLFGKGQNPDIGVINGHVIKGVEWNDLVAKRRGLFNYNSGNSSVYNDVWNDFTERTLLAPEYKELGLVVTEEELDGVMFGENLSPYVLRTHYQNMDTISRERVRTQWEQIQIQNPDYYNGHMEIVKQRRLKEKYDNMLKKGLYANKLDGKYSYSYNNDVVNIKYVTKAYTEIADSLITYTEADVRAYYNKHKNDEEWKNAEDARVVEFIYFSVTPTAEDTAEIKAELESLKAGWSTAASDSAYVTANTASGAYVKLKYADGDFAGPENAKIVSDSIGSIVGPYTDGSFVRMVKLIGREMNT
ncbi:MAG: peptidyl-prolyl cis-trans isomerase, partial [Flavobacteriales bacterium]|nr:peptidyl-prolyl cis-trans isomerase [Flavobacteriales bacterium]